MGLVEALARKRVVRSYDIPAGKRWSAFISWCAGRFPEGLKLPAPDLILGAGHRTHFSMLAARRARGGKAVVLMKPSLPTSFFDLCLIPRHDAPPKADNILQTFGALNPVLPAENAVADRGLFLIGGPSAHHGWDTAGMLARVKQVLGADRSMRWILTTSRRTPEDCVAGLVALREPNLEVVPFPETPPGWVAARLQECASVWVSEDSVSMVFEALTAGAAVGLLAVPAKRKKSRVQKAVEDLIQSGWVVRLEDVSAPYQLTERTSPKTLAEADRCATVVLRKFCFQDL